MTGALEAKQVFLVEIIEEHAMAAALGLASGIADWVHPVARAGGLLAVPANDWREVQEAHHRVATWAAVIAGLPVIRATGHGVSAIIDAAGRVLERGSSFDRPVVLVADVAPKYA